jgi:hypothetical protein
MSMRSAIKSDIGPMVSLNLKYLHFAVHWLTSIQLVLIIPGAIWAIASEHVPLDLR